MALIWNPRMRKPKARVVVHPAKMKSILVKAKQGNRAALIALSAVREEAKQGNEKAVKVYEQAKEQARDLMPQAAQETLNVMDMNEEQTRMSNVIDNMNEDGNQPFEIRPYELEELPGEEEVIDAESGAYEGFTARIKMANHKPSGKLLTSLAVYSPGDKLVWFGTLETDMQEIRREVMRALSNRVGWSFKGALKSAMHMAKKVANKRVLRGVKSLLNDPRLKIIASSVPGLSTAMQAYDQGSKLLSQARQGSKTALSVLSKVKEQASKGNEKATRAWQMMKMMDAYRKQGEACPVKMAIGAYFYNKNYRSPFMAKLDTNPMDVVRATYYRGNQLLLSGKY